MMRPRFTNAGRALHMRSLAGIPLVFTKMQIGDGVLGEADYQIFDRLISPKVTLELSGIKIDDGTATIKGKFTNADLQEGFNYRELGLFAKDPDNPGNDILYCYANFGDDYQYIAETSSQFIERTIRVVAVVDDATNVSAVIKEQDNNVDAETLMAAIQQHNTDIHAHENLISFDVTYYIDSTTQEDADQRDGSLEHPFMRIQEAVDAIPLSALRVRLVLTASGATYVGMEKDEWLSNYDVVEVVYTGEEETRPIIAGHLRFKRCGVVLVDNISITAAAETQENPRSFSFDACPNVFLHRIRGTILEDDCIFVYAYASVLYVDDMTTINAYRTLQALYGSKAYLLNCAINGGNVGIGAMTGSEVHILDNVTNTATVPVNSFFGGILMDSDTAKDITDGSVHSHIHSKDNPHGVSLSSAQNIGGTVDVAHGGTGKTKFDKGALLQGGEDGTVSQVLGTGAMYSRGRGNPEFGTLPIEFGGTGMIDGGTHILDFDINGVCPGSVRLPGGVVILWGKISTEGNKKAEFKFNALCDRFYDGYYALVLSGQEDVWGSITKYTDRFEVDVGGSSVATYVADWIAIGKGAEN